MLTDNGAACGHTTEVTGFSVHFSFQMVLFSVVQHYYLGVCEISAAAEACAVKSLASGGHQKVSYVTWNT